MKLLLLYTLFWVDYSLSARPNQRQEAAKVEYFNPKYFSEAYAFTSRKNRNSAYLTNVTATSIVPIGNNVTIRLQHNMKNSPLDVEIVRKTCDILKISWLKYIVKKYTNIDADSCPIVAKTYHVYNLELERDVIMMPIPMGINELRVVYEITDTGETMLRVSTVLYVF